MIKLIDYVEAVAFDLDGTLIDTAPDLTAACNMMLAILGGHPLSELRVAALIGGGVEQLVAGVLTLSSDGAAPDPTLLETAAALFRDLYRQRLFERSRLYPGVIESLRALARRGIFSCCITNKESAFALPLIEAAGIGDLLAFTWSADRAEDRKPSPNMLLAACAHIGIKPPRMLYVGDAQSDVLAARAAGCRVVAVDYGYHNGLLLAAAGADGVVSNLTELVDMRARAQKRCVCAAGSGSCEIVGG
jgi:phosphoglycolate phosphatase